MLNQIKLAFADDHILIRQSLIELLSTSKEISVIVEADNGIDLIRRIENLEKLPDVCLLDINMPIMNGFETLVQLKKRWPSLKVLILTMFDNDLYFSKMISEGANGYITKTCTADVLLNAIKSIYNNGFYNPDKIAQALSDSIRGGKSNLQLTETEKIFLKHCCSDLTYKEIAEEMNVSKKSVEGHRDYLFKKLGVNSRPSLVMFAIQYGIFLIDR